MSFRPTIASAVLLFCCVASATAQTPQGVKLEFHDGRVNLSAQNAPVRTILNEWARLGGTKIVNGERVPGGVVTLELNGVPERQALDTVLRAASGYLAGPRQPGTAGQSAYASIVILATSTAVRAVATPPPAFVNGPQPFNGTQPFNGPQPQPFIPGQQTGSQFNPDDDPVNDVPADANAQGGARPRAPQNFVPPNRPAVPGQIPGGGLVRPFPPEVDNDQPEPPAPAAPSPVPTNPFGVSLGSSRPGVISPVPQPQQQRPNVDPEP